MCLRWCHAFAFPSRLATIMEHVLPVYRSPPHSTISSSATGKARAPMRGLPDCEWKEDNQRRVVVVVCGLGMASADWCMQEHVPQE